jgi:hypothetical protein
MLVAIRCNQMQCIKFVAQWHSSLCESHPPKSNASHGQDRNPSCTAGTSCLSRKFSKADGWLLCHMSLCFFVCKFRLIDSDPWWNWWQFHVHISQFFRWRTAWRFGGVRLFDCGKICRVATIGRARGAMKTMDNGCNGCFLHVGTLAAQTNCDWQQHAFSTFQDRTDFVRASPVRETARWR